MTKRSLKTTIFSYISLSGVVVALVVSSFVVFDHKKTLENDILYKMHIMADDIIEHKLYKNSESELKDIFTKSESYHKSNYLASLKDVSFSFDVKLMNGEEALTVCTKLPDGRSLSISSSYDYIYQEIVALLGRLAVALIVTLGVIIGVFYILLEKLFYPLKCLIDYCHNIRPEKNVLDRCSSSYEIDALKDAILELQQRNNSLCQEKQNIFKEAAHEIKTPIAILKARVSLFNASDMPKNEFVRDTMLDISTISNKLRELIFLKAIEQDIQKAKESVPMQKQCSMMQQLFRPILEKKSLTMVSNLEEDFNLYIHKEANGRVMQAIFENIFMHTKNGTTIHTYIDPKSHKLSIINEVGEESDEILFSSHIGTKIIERLSDKLEYKYITYEKDNFFHTEIIFEGQK